MLIGLLIIVGVGRGNNDTTNFLMDRCLIWKGYQRCGDRERNRIEGMMRRVGWLTEKLKNGAKQKAATIFDIFISQNYPRPINPLKSSQ